MSLFFRKKKNKGFTIFELLITIAVLCLLAFFIMIVIPAQISKARDAERKADLEKAKLALYDYFFDEDCFPQDLPSCNEDLKLNNTVYFKNFPCDSKGNEYVYQREENECPQWFRILTNLENLQDGGIDKVGCQNGCGPECQYNYGLSSSNILVNEGCVVTYSCSPGGNCLEYEDPAISECPRIFTNDPSCQNACSERTNRCHDERGKKTPEE